MAPDAIHRNLSRSLPDGVCLKVRGTVVAGRLKMSFPLDSNSYRQGCAPFPRARGHGAVLGKAIPRDSIHSSGS